MMRSHREIYDHLEHYPRRIVIPHRLNPYPTTVSSIQYLYLFNSMTHHFTLNSLVCVRTADTQLVTCIPS